MKNLKTALLLSTCLVVSACSSTLQRVEEIKSGPIMAEVQNPTTKEDYKPVTSWPTPVAAAPNKSANSLWQSGSRSFFKDQRATRVGDILTVVVKISDKADLDSSTETTKSNEESIDASTFFGLESKIGKVLPGDIDPGNLADISTNNAISGSGKIGRKEDIETKVAAIVTQILPNGNLVIKGTQQVKVNHEMREMQVEGVIRPEDISSDNTIQSEQIAEARISYGGRGTITYANQPRYGSDIIDIISPF
jgi:flagellar L-ring protein precursor FlgH